MKKNSDENFIVLFGNAWNQGNPEGKLAAVFMMGFPELISFRSSNDEVLAAIRAETDSIVVNAIRILERRLNHFGIKKYKVERSEIINRIVVDIQNIEDTSRVQKLLLNKGKFEFYETYEYKELYEYFDKADRTMALRASSGNELTASPEKKYQPKPDSISIEMYAKLHPLFAYLVPALAQDENGAYSPAGGPVVGYCNISDTSRVNKLLMLDNIRFIFPRNLRFAWTIKPVEQNEKFVALIALKVNLNGGAVLGGDVVTEAHQNEGQNGRPEINISMNAEGARIWKVITTNNISRAIAMVIDNYVYSYPIVQTEIAGGHSTISGNFTVEEAEDIADLLQSGCLPVPLLLIEQKVTSKK
jgi:SecD/SecF fusion protein